MSFYHAAMKPPAPSLSSDYRYARKVQTELDSEVHTKEEKINAQDADAARTNVSFFSVRRVSSFMLFVSVMMLLVLPFAVIYSSQLFLEREEADKKLESLSDDFLQQESVIVGEPVVAVVEPGPDQEDVGGEEEEETSKHSDDDGMTNAELGFATPDSKSGKPNFVFILADDLGWNSIGYQNLDLDFATPFLTTLAQKSIVMSNYYAQESCTPSRASLLTGRYPLTIGMQFNEVDVSSPWALPVGETLISQVLQDADYGTYMIGKWNLGHYHPQFLPNARGFDEFMGFMTGQSYYWSKKSPQMHKFVDLLYGDSGCYMGYNGTDMHDYSTFLYTDKAIAVIEQHNFKHPMFMYLAYQAVHDPFVDYRNYKDGVPPDYLSDSMYKKVMEKVTGRKRRQYAMSLILLDEAVSDVYDALDANDQLENTYIIFASDNGGCYEAGGKNGPLRGTKGSLYEGGTKVDAFMYSPLISSDLQGSTYDGVFHVSDWFPTILQLAEVNYTPDGGYELDGTSQVSGMAGNDEPRDFMLYNYYINVDEFDFNMYVNGPLAIRMGKYKLIHAFVDNPSSQWYDYDETMDDDANLAATVSSCSQSDAIEGGTFTYMLFNLDKDPYETTNLYGEDKYESVQTEMYTQLVSYFKNSAADTATQDESKVAKEVWVEADGYIVPWVKHSDVKESDNYKDLPSYCVAGGFLAPTGSEPESTDDKDATTFSPTHKPSKSPTYEPTKSTTTTSKPSRNPTNKPSKSPTHKPTSKPSHTTNSDLEDTSSPSFLTTSSPSSKSSSSSPPSPATPPSLIELTHNPTPSLDLNNDIDDQKIVDEEDEEEVDYVHEHLPVVVDVEEAAKPARE